jgi:hypothetical protein
MDERSDDSSPSFTTTITLIFLLPTYDILSGFEPNVLYSILPLSLLPFASLY